MKTSRIATNTITNMAPEKNYLKIHFLNNLVKPGMDAESMKHVLTRKQFSIFGVFKLAETDWT